MPGEIKHHWVGTTLMVESDAGVSGCDLKGQTGDMGPRGPQGPAGVVDTADKIDGVTIIQNGDGILSTTIGGGMRECLAKSTNINKRQPVIGKAGNSNVDIKFMVNETYSFYFTFSDGGTSAFTLTIPATTTYNAVITVSDSAYFKSFTMFYTPNVEGKYDNNSAETMLPSYHSTVDTNVVVKDVYIAAGDAGILTSITPYVIPIDGNTIQINSDGKLTALAGGGGGDYTPTTETWTFTLEDGTTVNKVVCVG